MAPLGFASRFFIASGCPITTTTRYRCLHLQEQLKFLGYKSDIAEWFEGSEIDPYVVKDYDALFLYRIAMSPPIEHLVHQAHQSGKPLIFDADDLIFEPGLVDWHRAVSDLSAVERELH